MDQIEILHTHVTSLNTGQVESGHRRLIFNKVMSPFLLHFKVKYGFQMITPYRTDGFN
jgi:hypothetical protein